MDVTNGWNLIEAWAFGQKIARGSDSIILQDIVAVLLNKATFNLQKQAVPIKGTRCLGLDELVYEKRLKQFVMKSMIRKMFYK